MVKFNHDFCEVADSQTPRVSREHVTSGGSSLLLTRKTLLVLTNAPLGPGQRFSTKSRVLFVKLIGAPSQGLNSQQVSEDLG